MALDNLEKFDFKQVNGSLDLDLDLAKQARAEQKRLKVEQKLRDEGWHGMARGLNQSELLSFRDIIDQYLTEVKLEDLNLVQALLFQIKRAKELQLETKSDDSVPVAQKVQTANSLANMYKELSKAQQEIYSSERMKRMEGALIRALRTVPEEVQTLFFQSYSTEIARDPVDRPTAS